MKFDLVISLCDGIGLARTSLALAGVKFDRYMGIEIDPVARRIADYRAARDGLPPIERRINCWGCGGTKRYHGCKICAHTIGKKFEGEVECHDIRKFSGWMVPWSPPRILIIAGIPCTERSLANKNFTGAERVGEETDSGLIREFTRILREVIKHARRFDNDEVHWILENVPSAKAANDDYNRRLGVEPVEINAAWFGAQHRRRLFWSSWEITAPPQSEWSNEVFADIADKNPPGRRYDYVLWESARRKDGKPHRVGVLPTPSVLKQISKCGTMPQPKVYDGDNKMAAAQAVGSLPDGGGDQATVADAGSKMYSLKGAAVKIGDWQTGRSDDVMDENGKVNAMRTGVNKQAKMTNHGGRKTDGNVVRREFNVGGKMLELEVVKDGARCLTVGEIERLFGLPTDDTAAPGVSKTARIRAIGGGWDVRQMAHCLRQIGNERRELI